MDLEKGLMRLLWIIVAITIILFVVVIVVGYSNNFDFFFSHQDVTELSNAIVNKSSLLG